VNNAFGMSAYYKEYNTFPILLFVENNLQISFIVDADNIHHLEGIDRNFVTIRCTVVLLGTSLSGYALLNASLKANDFDAK
jgi:hypothetical protein